MAILNNEYYFYLSAVIFVILVNIGNGLTAAQHAGNNCAAPAGDTRADYNQDWPASFGIGNE